MEENEELLGPLFSKEFLDARAGLTASMISDEDVDARKRMFEQMTNTFDERMTSLRDVLFLL